MIDFASISQFSRSHCGAICSVLVPLNLLLTGFTLTRVFFPSSRFQGSIKISVLCATFMALILMAHVGTWLSIGVVRSVTFILFGLSLTCLSVNWASILYGQTWREMLQRQGYDF